MGKIISIFLIFFSTLWGEKSWVDSLLYNEKISFNTIFKEEYPQNGDINFIKSLEKAKKRIKKIKQKIKKPLLVIVIDDISYSYQLKRIKALPFKVTPSIFPQSYKLATNLNHFIIHLPLQSKSRALNKMKGTLFINDSKKRIKKQIKKLRELFPKAKFINNHTGSSFTSNYIAMKRLYKEILNNNFIFIDSRTSSKSKVKKIAKELNQPYMARSIFLDNKQKISYIIRQLKMGVRFAKKYGYAIVIGHPHPATFRALELSKPILKGVKVVYIDELYNRVFKR